MLKPQKPEQLEQIENTLNTGLELAKQAESLQNKLDNLSEEQQKALLELIVRKIQLEITQNHAILKDIIDGGVGLVPIIGDVMQLIFTLQILIAMKKQIKTIDPKTLMVMLSISAADIGIGLFTGPGDLMDMPLVANYFIRSYIADRYNKALEAALRLELDSDILALILDNSKQALKLLQK